MVNIPLARGLSNRVDERALEPPALAVLRNAEFEELGGVQKRRPFTALASGPDDIRRLVAYEDELLVFTSDELQTYSASSGDLQSRGRYFAAKVEEASVFTRSSEQTSCERAELGGVVVYAWIDASGSTSRVMVAATDKATGATLVYPTAQTSGTTRPRLVALTNRILLLYLSGTFLVCKPIAPATVAADIAAAAVTVNNGAHSTDAYLDAMPQTATTAVLGFRNTLGQVGVVTVNESGTVTQSNLGSGRSVDGPIAMAVAPNGTVALIRTAGTNLRADLLTSALADSTVNLLLGAGATTVNQVAAVFRLDNTCYVYWSSNEQATPPTNFATEWNTVTSAGAVGTEATFFNRLGVASRAFRYGSHAMVWLTFGTGSTTSSAQVQNTYFLVDQDGNVHAKAVPASGGGFATLRGQVPSVQAVSATQFAGCLVERRIIPIGPDERDYAQRSPREVIVTMDANEARRCVQLGRTLYVTGGQVMQYDGAALVELGFPIFPFNLSVVDPGTAGSLGAGTYAWTLSARWENAKGELERSTSAVFFDAAIAASRKAAIATSPVHVTGKRQTLPAYEIWRTLANPVFDSPYYLITSKSPTASGDNGYLENDPSVTNYATYNDNFSDSTLARKEPHPENGGVLENLAPPAATIIAAGQDRLFLAGIPGAPDRIAYSKLRGLGELAAFHDSLYLDLPADGGPITALAFLNDTLIAFKERGIYAVSGLGLDNLGGGDNYYARVISTDIGATSHDAVAVTPEGVLFHTPKGWHVLDRSLSPRYVGAAVADFDGFTFSAVHVVDSQHQVRCFGRDEGGPTAVVLAFDVVAEAWSEWTLGSDVRHSAWHDGAQVLATADGLERQESAHGASGYDFHLDVETPWIKLADLQGFRRIRRFMLLGEYRSAHRLRVRVAYDYDDTWIDDKTWTPSPTTVGGPLQVEHRPSRPKGQAIKIRITDLDASTSTPPAGEALKLTGLALEVGRKRGLYKRLPAAQKQ